MIYDNGIFCLDIEIKDELIVGIEFRAPAFDSESAKPTTLEREIRIQFDEYFDLRRESFELPIMLQGTEFQVSVWQALAEIPFGQTRSYSDIAIAIGKSKAVRAVGGAIGANPIPVIIPCHRVIGRDGSIVGFRGGTDIKRLLLDLEARGNE